MIIFNQNINYIILMESKLISKYEYINLDDIINEHKEVVNSERDERYLSTSIDIDSKFKTRCNRFRIFNPSIIKLDDGSYLYSFRLNSPINNEKIIPGNACYEDDFFKTLYPNEKGKNFWWNHWGEYANYCRSITLFFRKENNKFKYLKYKNLSNEEKFQDYIVLEDIRLAKVNNIKYLYTRHLMPINEITAIHENYFEISNVYTIMNPGHYGLNMQLIYIEDDNRVIYLDWIDTTGLYFTELIYHKPNIKHYIKFDDTKKTISGLGSIDNPNDNMLSENNINYGITPMFSFSTPLVEIEYEGKKALIGVGHIKIHSDNVKYKYKENSNIENFRNMLYTQMPKHFNNKYIKHFGADNKGNCMGYIYMLYFFILFNYDNKTKTYKDMIFSDAYLPINLDEKLEYRFSLYFACGLEINDGTLIVTGGEGDYYATELHFDLNEVIKLCNQDIKNPNMIQYEYFMLAYKDKKTYINNNIDDLFEGKIKEPKKLQPKKKSFFYILLIILFICLFILLIILILLSHLII